MTADFFTESLPPENVLRDDLLDMIKARDRATERHQQVALGPSEIGHPCLRKMAYGLMAVEKANPYYDPLPSIIGTATHTWLASAADLANTQLGRDRWFVETKVQVAPNLSGSADLYDWDTGTVIDWKVPGQNRFAAYRKEMPAVYRAQVHMYGKGFANKGFPVKTVAIALLPRGGSLVSMHLWSEPYNERVADWAVGRRDKTIALLSDWDVENHPERYSYFAKSGPDCMFCPWWRKQPDSALQCEGV